MSLPDPYYQDDRVTLYHGDSRELLPHITADVMVTDPPYGIGHKRMDSSLQPGRDRSLGRSIQSDGDTTARDSVLQYWGNRPAIMFGDPLKGRPDEARQMLVWDKDDGGAGVIGNTRGFRRDWEAIYLLGDWPKSRESRSAVLRFGGSRRLAASVGHPHAKPVALMRYLIRSAPPGIIVDPFCGAGSTLRAAKDEGRECIGVELDERWCETAANRAAQEALL